MCALLRKNSALNRRIKELEKEIASLNGDIKVLSKVAKSGARVVGVPVPAVVAQQREVAQQEVQPEYHAPAHQPETRMPASVLKQPSIEYTQPRSQLDQTSRKAQADRDQITRDGRFATYLMSRDFHDVRPLRHERHIQRNKAIFMVVVMVVILLYLVIRFMP
jgi:hypothetical protein